MKFTIDETLSAAEAEMLSDRIDTYNAQKTGFTNERPLQLAARDADGNLLGGLTGSTGLQWLYIHVLWIEDPYRQDGIGSSLLKEAEQLGVQRGCRSSCLMTFSFQAREFYERFGYAVFGQLDDYPEGHTLYFMQKKITIADPRG